MAIRSLFALPTKFEGKGWEAQLLPAPGKRAGMKCIYKIKNDGDSKRAGLYIESSSATLVKLNIGGDNFLLDMEANEIKYSPRHSGKYHNLVNDPVFMEVVNLTLAHFDIIPSPEGVYNAPAPRVTELTEEEAAGIFGLGLF